MTLLNVAQIIVAVLVIVIILAQAQGGGLSGMFGGSGESAFRTRRGIERTLFRFTVVLVVAFIALSIVSVKYG
jgi:preprotein translocase subunit SecG